MSSTLVVIVLAYIWWRGARSIVSSHKRSCHAWQKVQSQFQAQHPIMAGLGFGYERPRAGAIMAFWTVSMVIVAIIVTA